MNDIDALRTALLSDRTDGMSVDVDRIMALGNGIRRRRRLATGGAALAVTAALLIGITGVTHWASAVRTPQTDLVISGGEAADPAARPLGAVIDTGYRDPQGPHVLFVTADTAGQIDLTEGYRSGGSIVPEIMGSGSTVSSGFHAITQLLVHNGHDTLVFGLYNGPAARVTIDVDGRTVPAHVTPWSRDRNIVVFWFDPRDVPITAQILGLHAFDAVGNSI